MPDDDNDAAGLSDDGTMDDDYELIDAGDGARLERFGTFVVDRPAPGAFSTRRSPDRWAAADLRFDRGQGWSGPALADAEKGWTIHLWELTMELRPTAAGQVGVYPEHTEHLSWLAGQVTERRSAGEPVEVLHLFAATGLASLAMAGWGASVAHVDAARPTIARARRNAERNGLADKPVRWIVDDAMAFAERERRRGRRYSGIVLDPPTYGHGARAASTSWSMERDLAPLLQVCGTLLADDGFVLLTAHTEGIGPSELYDALEDVVPPGRQGSAGASDVELHATSGAVLVLGAAATWDGRG